VKDAKVEMTETHLKFSATAQGKDYNLEIEFFKEINPQESKYAVLARHIVFNIVKKEEGPHWDRLTKVGGKQWWLKADWGRWVEEDEEDEAGEGGDFDMGGMGMPGGMGGMPPGMMGMPGMGGMGGMPPGMMGMPGMGGMGGMGGMNFGDFGGDLEGEDDEDDDDEDDDGISSLFLHARMLGVRLLSIREPAVSPLCVLVRLVSSFAMVVMVNSAPAGGGQAGGPAVKLSGRSPVRVPPGRFRLLHARMRACVHGCREKNKVLLVATRSTL
jgi:hypothetical protein